MKYDVVLETIALEWFFHDYSHKIKMSDVEVRYELRVRFDERPARLDLVTHQRLEHLVGEDRVLDVHLEDRACLRIHRRRPELTRIHLSESLVALDVDRALAFAVAETRHVVVTLLLVVRVVLLLPLRHAIERRLRDVEVARFDQLGHLAIEESQQKRPDVRPVHVGVRHQDQLVIADVLDREILLDSGADGGDDRPDLLVRQHLVDARLLDVQNLSAQGKNRLERTIAALLRRAARAVTLDEIDLAERRIAE